MGLSTEHSCYSTFYKVAQPLLHTALQVTDHSYHYIYSKYLAPARRDSLRLLEIGLGNLSTLLCPC